MLKKRDSNDELENFLNTGSTPINKSKVTSNQKTNLPKSNLAKSGLQTRKKATLSNISSNQKSGLLSNNKAYSYQKVFEGFGSSS